MIRSRSGPSRRYLFLGPGGWRIRLVGLCRGRVSRNESLHSALRQPESLCRRFDSQGHWSIGPQRLLNDTFTFLCLRPVQWIDDPEFLDAVIELGDREQRQPPQFGDRNVSKISGAGFLDASPGARQAFQPMYAALPQHQLPGSQFQAKGRIGRRRGRKPSPRIWTRNAINVRFVTQNAEMFIAPFAAARFLGVAANSSNFSSTIRSLRAFQKIAPVVMEETDSPSTTDVDNGDWSKATTYPVGSIVEYAGSSYIALLKSTALRPDKNPNNWAVFAAAGPAGAIGQTGPAGTPGAQGPQGPVGATGAAGPAGAPGPMGPAGAIGPQGPQGQQGPAGAVGATGPAGPAGKPGLSCPNGNTTPTVPAGKYVDCGDGTLVDTSTGLMWEETDANCSGEPQCYTTTYSASVDAAPPYTQDGSLYTTFLAALNDDADSTGSTPCFANHCDWRIPKVTELSTIVNLTASGCGGGLPCIDPAFGPTQTNFYWTSSSLMSDSSRGWGVSFYSGALSNGPKSDGALYARAVRGAR